MNFSLGDWKAWLFGMVVAAYAVLLPLDAEFSPIGDHLFLTTLLANRKMDFYIEPSIGRFVPLLGQEYNLIALLSASPTAFYVYNMIQFLVVVFGLLKVMELCLGVAYPRYLGYAVVLVIAFSPGFVTSWFMLLEPEHDAFVFFLLFLILYLLYQKEQKLSYLIGGLLAANIALYYKEPGFVMLGAFAFFHLAFGWHVLNVKQKVFDAFLMASSILFIGLYYVVVFVKRGPILYGDSPHHPLILFLRNVEGYFLSDPFIMVLLFGLVIYRACEVVTRQSGLEPVYDSALLAAMLYVLTFLKLNLGGNHYLLPSYVFATLGLVHFLVKAQYVKKPVFKAALALSLLLYVTSALPLGIHLISFYKVVPINYNRAVEFLTQYIKQNERRVAIYVDGVSRGSGLEIYRSLEMYLLAKGLNTRQFDLRSDIPSDNSLLFSKGDPTSPFSVYRDPGPTQINSGDLLLITPYTYKPVDQKYVNSLRENYELLYHAGSFVGIPRVNLKSLVKYGVMRLRALSPSVHDVVQSANFFAWPDYYVFRRKGLSSV